MFDEKNIHAYCASGWPYRYEYDQSNAKCKIALLFKIQIDDINCNEAYCWFERINNQEYWVVIGKNRYGQDIGCRIPTTNPNYKNEAVTFF